MAKGQKSEVQKKRKSRDAARQRRGQQNDEFSELASHLPLPFSVSGQLDRLCIMRLTNSYVKVKHVINQLQSSWPLKNHEEVKLDPEACLFDASTLDALGGFVFIISMDGQCVFTSPNVIDYLGISQLELMGCSMYKFVHPCDQEELAKQLDGQVPLEDMEIFDGLFCNDNYQIVKKEPAPVSFSEPQSLKSTYRSFFLRMRSTITSRGKSVNLNASIFRVVHCLGSLHYYCTSFNKTGEGVPSKYLVAVGTPLLSSDSFEVPLDRMTFTSTHGLDMKLVSSEDRISELLGFPTSELLGRSWYCFTHACDIDVLKSCHKIVLSKGQGISGYYRMMTKTGGWVWMQTKGNVVYSNVSFQPQYIICVNYLVSGVEAQDQLLSTEQITLSGTTAVKCSRKRALVKADAKEEPRAKVLKAALSMTLTPPHSDEEVEGKPYDPWMPNGKDQYLRPKSCTPKYLRADSEEVFVPTSGEEEHNLLRSLQEHYENKLVEEYSIHLEDDEDFDDELPSLEFVDMDAEFDGIELGERSLGELLEDESFLARAPFIPPPTVDEMLTSLLDGGNVDSDDEDSIMHEKFNARAPYVPETSFDVPLSFDELESSPLPLVPDFDESPMKATKNECEDTLFAKEDGIRKLPGKITEDVRRRYDRGRTDFCGIGAAVVPRSVIETSLKEHSRGKRFTPLDPVPKSIKRNLAGKRRLSDEDEEPPCSAKRLFSKFGKGVNLGKEALVYGRVSALPYITKDDAEVNAPSNNLLHGADLLSALDYVSG